MYFVGLGDCLLPSISDSMQLQEMNSEVNEPLILHANQMQAAWQWGILFAQERENGISVYLRQPIVGWSGLALK